MDEAERTSAGPQYKVSITGPGANIERDIPFEVFRRILMLLYVEETETRKGAAKPVAAEGSRARPAVGIGDAAPSLREYFDRHEASTNSGKLAAVGAFKKAYSGENSLTPEELTQAFLDAGEPSPANLPRDIKETIRKGWIARKPGEDDIYYVTGSGEKAVQANFQVVAKGGARRRRRTGRRARTGKPSD